MLSPVLWRRRLRCRSGSGGVNRCALARRYSPPLAAVTLGMSGVAAAAPASAAPPKCSDLNGTVDAQQMCQITWVTPAYTLQHRLPGRLSRRAGGLRLHQADPRRLPQRGKDARLPHHALPAGGHRRPSTTRRSRRGARSRWCSRRSRMSAGRTRRPSTSRSTGIRATASRSRSTPWVREDPAVVPAGHQPVAGDLPAGAGGAGEAAGISRRDRARGRA